MKIVAIDVETTGLDPAKAAIISVGLCHRRSGGTLATNEFRCNPGEQYLGSNADRALEINGFTREQIRGFPDMEEVAHEFRSYLFNLIGKHGPFLLIAYNQSFDGGFLARAPWRIRKGWWGDCVMERHTDVVGQRESLINAVGHWEVKLDGIEGRFHGASYDAAAAYLIYEAMRISGEFS